MSAREKIAYLKGLIDGQNLTDTPDKAKFYAALVDALDSLAVAIEEHEDVHEELNAYLEQLDEDVSDIEDELDELEGGECGCHSHDDDDEEDEYEDFDEEEYESVTCPNCGKRFLLRAGSLRRGRRSGMPALRQAVQASRRVKGRVWYLPVKEEPPNG